MKFIRAFPFVMAIAWLTLDLYVGLSMLAVAMAGQYLADEAEEVFNL